MMAMLWAQQIMLGKKTYAQVPRLLKDNVSPDFSSSENCTSTAGGSSGPVIRST